MKCFRSAVFETNSSSVHTLTVGRNTSKVYDYNIHLSKRGEVVLYRLRDKDFGWGPATYSDAYTKLNYLACMALQCWQYHNYHNRDKIIRKMSEIYNLPDIKKLERVCKKNIPGFNKFVFYPKSFDKYGDGELSLNWYDTSIDHYSYEGFRGVEDFLKFHKISIENFLFNPCVVLNISNDNE